MNTSPTGHDRTVEETNAAPRHAAPDHDAPSAEPTVSHTVEGDRVRVVVGGELTESARRPLVRTLTDLLLAEHGLQRVELDLRGVGFMNSAGLAVLVQLQKLGVPRGIETVLVDPPLSVSRPLQLTGLWHRFTVVAGDGRVVAEPSGGGGPAPRDPRHT
ncbi:stage II sporulation protein AA (anti-sigma F factor antagonist) [Blastococcus sp. DSM 46786]|uniref:STAS domain-containing protein n=1 Tax=Blastococcus sp. DSM 46786 TaxID=1798227 RepID=UPI0008BD0E4B|nr:STAS domain-containing protein [Blastococcus sp. DSM 46786]SEL59313.1 stage II sporulation protein AA (anti-sigma F factor antagonist) [Blastococcus sp. DSM 46786]